MASEGSITRCIVLLRRGKTPPRNSSGSGTSPNSCGSPAANSDTLTSALGPPTYELGCPCDRQLDTGGTACAAARQPANYPQGQFPLSQ